MLLLVSSQVFVNCGDDDGPAPPPEEFTRLLGTWDLEIIQEDGQPVNLEPSCAEQLRFEFRDDNTFTRTTFAGEDENNCQVSTTANGTWRVLEGDNYEIKFNSESDGTPLRLNFTSDNDRFTINTTATTAQIFRKQ